MNKLKKLVKEQIKQSNKNMSTWRVVFGRFKFFRRIIGGKWFLHEFTWFAGAFGFVEGDAFWARYGKLNKYTRVIDTEDYTDSNIDNSGLHDNYFDCTGGAGGAM